MPLKSSVDEDYEAIKEHIIADYRNLINIRYSQFNTFIDIAKQDEDFKNFTYIVRGNLLGYVFSYKNYLDYRVVVWYCPVDKTVSLNVVADEDGKGFADKDPSNGNGIIKYFDVTYLCEGDTIESHSAQIIKHVKETINAHRATIIAQEVDHSLTAEQFTDKIKDLMHPDKNSYLYADPISVDQENMLFYKELVAKINKHPTIWRMFFTI